MIDGDPGTGDVAQPEKPSGRLIGKRSKPEVSREAPTQAMAVEPSASASDAAFAETAFFDPSAPAPQSRALQVPERLGIYQVEREVARGGMGVVLEGIHPQLKRRVAIKLLRADVASDDPQAHDRFMREARATAKLRHPGIVAIHDVGEDEEGRTYLVMDFVRGEDLKVVLDRGRMPLNRVAELMERIAEAVAHAHESGILHRDLKPHNVLIDEQTGQPLLTDFGLAKSVGRKTQGNSSKIVMPESGQLKIDDAQLTQDGEVMGTPLYMAPEQIDPSKGKISTKTDVWALGVMLYELITGRTPFDRDSVWNIFDGILKAQPTPPSMLRGDVPEELESIVMRCLEKSPLARYRSARAVAKDLARFRQGAPVLGRTHRSKPVRSGGRLLPTVAAVGVLSLGALFLTPPEVKARVTKAASVLLGESPVEPKASPTPPPPKRPKQRDRPPRTRQPKGPAAPSLEERAEAGDPAAMLQLGRAILGGARPGDGHSGLRWIRKAAEAGAPGAYWILGQNEFDPDLKQQAFEAGGEAGDPNCLRYLINQQLKNTRDEAAQREASKWLQRLVEVEPRPDAHMTLANLNGQTAWGDRELARTHWAAAYELGVKSAAMPLAHSYRELGDDRRAREWLETAASDGDAEASFLMGRAYETGQLGLPPALRQAVRHYKKAARAGHEKAQERLNKLRGGRRRGLR